MLQYLAIWLQQVNFALENERPAYERYQPETCQQTRWSVAFDAIEIREERSSGLEMGLSFVLVHGDTL